MVDRKKWQIDTFESFLQAMKINYFPLAIDGSNIQLSDNSIKATLYEDYQYLGLAKCINSLASEGDVIIFQDRLSIITIAIRARKKSDIIILGPMLPFPPNGEYFARIKREGVVSEDNLPFLKTALEDVPVLPPSSQPYALILDMLRRVFKEEYKVVADEAEIVDLKGYILKQKLPDSSSKIDLRYEKENALLDAVASGDVALALQRYEEFINTDALKRRMDDQVQNMRNYTIVMGTLLRKSAERAGVRPVYIDYISSLYATEINSAKTVAYISLLSKKMIINYTELVRDKSLKEYSPVIREVIIYTDQHMSEKLSLSFFSDKFNISPTYLSALFSKEMKMSLTTYIRKVRLKEAEKLSKITALPLSVIATKVGYESASYLIRHFKAEYGAAPRRYKIEENKIIK